MKIVSTFLLFFAIAATSFAQSTDPVKVDGGNGIMMEWSSTMHKFGDIPKDVPAPAEFKVKNIGSQPIILEEVRPGCGCTTPAYTQQPILPGETGYVKGTYNAKNAGAFNKNITVRVKDVADPVMLYLSGTVLEGEAAPANGGK
jgi:hypothetical protein